MKNGQEFKVKGITYRKEMDCTYLHPFFQPVELVIYSDTLGGYFYAKTEEEFNHFSGDCKGCPDCQGVKL